MKQKTLWIVQTAVMLAMLIALQALARSLGQIVTGSCVNAVLAVTVLFCGMSSGVTVALISPVCAFLLGIAPNVVTILPIMIGNVCFVVLLRVISTLDQHRAFPVWRPVALVTASCVKFGVLYLLVVKVICGIASGALLGKKLGEAVVLAPPMLEKLPVMFAWPQLITALIGGAVALMIAPVLKKALHRN